ncbi:MAG TPA: toll/interleukin-1 receptor domain-containing protein [Ktedonobacteraceae bacterium]|nr:toll/interleukin-1 receptor domain-containing protein [Ktedonobacteraceae bacterium]
MPVKIFFCYAHEDEALLSQLKAHLKPLQRSGLISFWYDRDISAGTEWEREILDQLNTAQIILLLISPHFMSSEYCYGIELKRAMERKKRGEVQVIPIILEYVYWQIEPLSELQALPTDAKPIKGSGWHNENEALLDVTNGVRFVVEEIVTKKSHCSAKQTPLNMIKQISRPKASTTVTVFPYEPVIRFQENDFELLTLIERMEQDWKRQNSHEKKITALANYVNWMMDALSETYHTKNANLRSDTLELLLSLNDLSYFGNYAFNIIKRNHITIENFSALCYEVLRTKKANDFLKEASTIFPCILSCIFNFINIHIVPLLERQENQEIWEMTIKQFSFLESDGSLKF